jgi:DNA-binding NtrC family response regulator
VLQAEDGAAGVSALREHRDRVRCVLLDLSMPKMDGEAALLEMRTFRPDVPVVVMSGYSESQLTGRFAGGGVFEFMPKPFTLKQLTEAVQRAVRVGAIPRLH